MERAIVHMDLDTFFVSCERLGNAQLQGIPLIIGGGDRGVVASCSYEARRFGVRSAMPIKMALAMCPQARVIKGDMELYSKMSNLVTEVIEERSPLTDINTVTGIYDFTKGCLENNIKPLVGIDYDREHEGMDALRELAQKFEIDPRFCCYGRPEAGEFKNQQNTATLPDITVHNASIGEALALLKEGKESYAYLDRGRHGEERSCVYVENGAFCGMGYFPSDATVSDLSELKEYIDPYKSSHYVMKLIASFAARHPGKVKPIKKAISLNEANFENFD